ncbi:uncharacterized protein BCR38DRAFT_511258, partial [Pseudomassariella vexata]
LTLLSRTVAIEITDIFTVQPGASDGGCGDRVAQLDQSLSEGIESLDVALNAIDNYNNDIRVRRSLATIFGITNSGRLRESRVTADAVRRVRMYINHTKDFYNLQLGAGNVPYYDKVEFWLFCDITFLSLHKPAFSVSDYQGDDILDQNGNPIRVMDIP